MTKPDTDSDFDSGRKLRNNDGQIEFWNTGPGKNWARYQAGLDACFSNINARLIERCEMKNDGVILDVGCGTGATSLALAGKFGHQAQITGVDVSKPLLDYATQRIESSHYTNIRFLQADVQTHGFKQHSFDLIASRFGVMFFTEPTVAFKNLAIALKPDAKLNFVSWSTVDSNPWFSIPRDAAVDRLGKGVAGDPRAPGPTAFADMDYVHDILSHAGLGNISIEVENLTIETTLKPAEMAELACNLGPAVRLMKEKGGSEADARHIRAAVSQQLGPFKTRLGFSIPASIVVVSAGRAR